MQDLPFQTLTQFAGLGLMLIAGWFLGLASSSGGRKWRERFYDEEFSNASYRDRAEQDLRDNARRIRDLEAENARLRAAAPAEPAPAHEGHSTATVAGAAVAGAALGAAAAHAADHHHESHAEAAPAAADHAEPAHHAAAHDDHAPAHADAHHH